MTDTNENNTPPGGEKELLRRKQQIKRLFDAAFPKDKEWNTWFFDKVYRDDEAMHLEIDDKTVSCLFLQRYDFSFHGSTLGLAYVAGAATDFKMRHQGLMGQLLAEVLQKAYDRGDTFIGLIPAERRLFFLYDKFEFATVVFADIERFTALHTFHFCDDFQIVEPTYEAFSSLEKMRNSTVLHSPEDFSNILFDLQHDGGTVVQVNDFDNRPVAMAFAVSNGTEIHVKELLGVDNRAAYMALGEVKNKLAVELPMAVWRLPSGREALLRKRGMIRIINAENALRALAESHHDLKKTFRISDPRIEANNGFFVIENGKCRRTDNLKKDHKPDFDVSIDVLTKILFSSEAIGRGILGIPSSHPAMNLMLD